MNKQDYIDGAESALLHTYNRFPLVIDHGDGVYLYDTDGKEYLDFAAGIAVNSLGYHYPGYDEALKDHLCLSQIFLSSYYHKPLYSNHYILYNKRSFYPLIS